MRFGKAECSLECHYIQAHLACKFYVMYCYSSLNQGLGTLVNAMPGKQIQVHLLIAI